MGFIAVKCPSCGENINLDETREYGECPYCGTKVVRDKIVIEHRGYNNANENSNEKALVDRAYIFIEDGKFDTAWDYFERALDLNPYSARAYLGKLLCQLEIKSIDDLTDTVEKPLDKYELFNKAERFASEQEKEEILEIKAKVNKRLTDASESFFETIRQKEEALSRTQMELDNEKGDYQKHRVKRNFFYILGIVCGTFAGLFIIWCFFEFRGSPKLLIAMAVAAAGLIILQYFMLKHFKEEREAIRLYDAKKVNLLNDREQLEHIKTEQAKWAQKQSEFTKEKKPITRNYYKKPSYNRQNN